MRYFQRVLYQGVEVIATRVYSFGFITLGGLKVFKKGFKVIGPKYCEVCRTKYASILRTDEETIFQPVDKVNKTSIKTNRMLCKECNSLTRLPLRCHYDNKKACWTVCSKIVYKKEELWFFAQLCDDCQSNWTNARREQFLHYSLGLVRPVLAGPDVKRTPS